MLSGEIVMAAIADALDVESVTMEDSDLTVDTWDSLGQLSIQTKLSVLTAGASEDIEELAVVYSVQHIFNLLGEAGLLE
jgi:hypothetical protein